MKLGNKDVIEIYKGEELLYEVGGGGDTHPYRPIPKHYRQTTVDQYKINYDYGTIYNYDGEGGYLILPDELSEYKFNTTFKNSTVKDEVYGIASNVPMHLSYEAFFGCVNLEEVTYLKIGGADDAIRGFPYRPNSSKKYKVNISGILKGGLDFLFADFEVDILDLSRTTFEGRISLWGVFEDSNIDLLDIRSWDLTGSIVHDNYRGMFDGDISNIIIGNDQDKDRLIRITRPDLYKTDIYTVEEFDAL